MESINNLYVKTKQSLNFTNSNHPNKGIQILRDVQKELKLLKVTNPELDAQINRIEVIALNNLACAYNKKGKHKASLFNLQLVNEMEHKMFQDIQQSLKSSDQIDKVHQIATTHSNLCAVYSQMGQHQKALKQIKLAIQYLQKSDQKTNAFIVFYYNCAIQLQYLHNLKQAHQQANKGYSLCNNDEQLSRMFQQCKERLEDKMKKKEQKIGEYLLRKYKGVHNHPSKGSSLQQIRTQKLLLSLNKDISAYNTRMPTKRMRKSEYPKVKVIQTLDNSMEKDKGKRGHSQVVMESRRKVLSLYDTKNQIPMKSKLTLSKRKQTLSKLCSQQI